LRVIPLPPFLVNTLQEWKLACPKGERDLAFPNTRGGLDHQSSVTMRAFHPAQVRAGLVTEGRAKYGGLHSLAALLCVMVHQPESRRGIGVAFEGRASAAWARVNSDDG
jgi:hypothetical protein